MGIVLRQSVKNLVFTYLGFAFGAVNTLFLFTYFLSKEQYGLVSYVSSVATILAPLLSFGVGNTLIRYYSAYPEAREQGKLSLMLWLLPPLAIVPCALMGIVGYEHIAGWLSATNPIVGDYVLLIFLTSVVMAYFEVAYAWAKVQLRTVYGNFLKEVFHRVGISVLLICIYLEIITFEQLMWGVFWVYFVRMLLMMIAAFRLQSPRFVWGLPAGHKEVLLYSLFIILSGSIASLLMDIDKFMLNQYVNIGEIAVYNVAIFTATVIAIPYRSMYQIVSPLTAQFMNRGEEASLHDLYRRSTTVAYLLSMLIFVLIIANAKQFYALLPDKDYSSGIAVLVLVSLVKLSDSFFGFNNAVLLNSPYYRTVLYLSVFLVISAVLLNMWLIPLYGINGAGFATLCAFTAYNLLKAYFVYYKYQLTPLYPATIKTTLLGVGCVAAFTFWDFSFSPLVNITLKSVAIAAVYVGVGFRIKLVVRSEDGRRLRS